MAPSPLDFSPLGLHHPAAVFAHLSSPCLVEHALARGEGLLSDRGALVVDTGKHTGRAPRDRYLVADDVTREVVDWGTVNRGMEPGVCARLQNRLGAYLQGRDLFVTDAYACADPRYRVPVRVVADTAWHALFSRCLFRDPHGPGGCEPPAELGSGIDIVCATRMQAVPAVDGTRSEAFIVLDLERRLVLIGGTGYAGEVKKAVFSLLNYHLPREGVFPMHCAANVGPDGQTALFFGLSGTGKTTLSAERGRRLIGDDEHGWSDEGVFNIEGGCYAKCIRLSEAGEPDIYHALHFGSVLENVVLDPQTRRPDFDDQSRTENTRAAYPLAFIPGAEPTSLGGHPRHVLFLTCDAFGVLPPLSRLTQEQALYHFLSGYTAKVAGTEAGVTEPEATFSTCFAAPFLPLPPARYAELLAERLRRHGSEVWLVNTGWTEGPYGVGRRLPLAWTRAMVQAVLAGELEGVPLQADPLFGLLAPEGCPGVPAGVLRPRSTWASPEGYDARARQLAGLFRANFARHTVGVRREVAEAGPGG